MAKKKNNVYTDELRQEAVALINEQAYTVPDLTKSLNISPKLLYRWRDKFTTQTLDCDERAELLQLRKENCLMIYAALEHQIRKRLKEKQQYFPDTKNKPHQRPTTRWVLCCFEGIYELTNDGETMIQNIDERQRIFINILGVDYQQIYS